MTTRRTSFSHPRTSFDRRNRSHVLFGLLLLAGVIWAALAGQAQATLQAYWKLDDGVGTSAFDYSGNANNGTLVDGPMWDSGIFNGALNLDGLNDKVHVPSVAGLKYSGGDLTLSTWVYLDAGETSGRIISKPWNGSGRYNYILGFSGTSVYFSQADADTVTPEGYSISSAAIPSLTGTWHHLAAVADSSDNRRLYVDGSQVAFGVSTISTWGGTDLPVPLVLGSLYPYGAGWAGNNGFSTDGRIDDVAIWDEVIGPGKIASLAQLGLGANNPLQQAGFELEEMQQLWQIYDDQSTGTVSGLKFSYVENLDIAGRVLGEAWGADPGSIFLLLDLGTGAGVQFLVPEPSSMMLLGLGVVGMVFHCRRRRRKA